ncbi:MAG: hypothetical protein ACOX5T_07190 [Candidatus Cryptobacteroides sp.]
MKKFLLFMAAAITLSLVCGSQHKSFAQVPIDKMYVVATDYVAADGSVDVSDALQELIDANPNRTIFFPDGIYLLSKPVLTPADPSKAVHLVLANFAVIKASNDWKEDAGALIKLGGEFPYNDININGSNYGIEGGIFDGNGVADGISVDSGRETRITRVSIKHTKIGIHIKYGANNGSSDSDIVDVNIVGNDQKNSIGVLIEGHDNTLTNMRIASVNVGIWCKSGGNSLKNLHPLYIFKPTQDYESSVGFIFESSNNWCDYCYSDQFATGFKINGPHCINLTDCFCWWYSGKVPTQTAIVCDGTLESFVYGLHVGFSKECPVVNLLVAEKGGNGNMQNTSVRRTDYSEIDTSSSYTIR